MTKKAAPNYLDMVPIHKVEEYVEEEGKITLLIPKFRKEWMRRWFIPARRSKHFRIHLDELGTEVWRHIDGKTDVHSICQRVSEYLQRSQKQEAHLEERVTVFLNQLYKNRFIVFQKM
ncbi:MAG TPA: PqqD family protein [Bacteroidales bacterium]|nr:PqqD family protein [Bacteroidales bacterium]